MNPSSTDCEADALIATRSRRSKTELAADTTAKEDLEELKMYQLITENFLEFFFPNEENA